MTAPADLLDEDCPDPVVLMLAWLLPIADSPAHLGMTRIEGAPLPFYQVSLIESSDEPDGGEVTATVSVHFMAAAAGGVDADTLAVRGGRVLHRRMMRLARFPSTNIAQRDGAIVNVDWVETVERPAWRDYEDTQISRVKGVYRLGLSYVAVP